MITRALRGVVAICIAFAAGEVGAVSAAAQEYMDIHSKIAPDQCALQKLSAQAQAALRDGDRGKSQELSARMEPIAKRIQTFQPRLQELAKAISPTSSDFAVVTRHLQDLRASCK